MYALLEKTGKKASTYIIKWVSILLATVLLSFGAFFSSMKTSTIYFLLNDALKARLDVILLEKDIDDYSRFFSYNYLSSNEYELLKEDYSLYSIVNYGYKNKYSRIFVWPWQKTKTVIVKESVFAINGEIDTSQISKEDAIKYGVYNIPEWKSSRYKVKLVLEDGAWVIDSIQRTGDYKYKPVKTHDLTEEEIEALKTPSPTPSPIPTPTPENSSGEFVPRSAKITTALSGQTVNLREGPATAYKILKVLKRGHQLTVVDETDGWYEVECDGVRGYVSGYYIAFD